jgi:DNA-directed RNA polymerase subunit A"
MTLNSVDYNTAIIIMCNNKILTPKIGEWIDDYYVNCDQSKVQHLENNQIYIELDDGHDWKALSCDENGNMMWTKLEAITRHPVVNRDRTDTILEVELESGRTVRATKGKSFLTLINGKIQSYEGYDLKVGDILPIATTLALQQVNLTIDDVESEELRWIESGKQFIYTENGIQEDTQTSQRMNDIVWDKVKSIKETRPIHGWMYDLTVEKTHNFLTANGINMFDEMRRKQEACKACYLLVRNQQCLVLARQPGCGKLLRVYTTTLDTKVERGTRLIAEPNGNNV